MNSTNIIKLVAALAWGGVAVSSASTANALAITTQSGSFATCAAQSSASYQNWCLTSGAHEERTYLYETLYVQQIKFVSTNCNQGGCTPDSSQVSVDFIYPVGRKVVTSHSTCGNTITLKHVYGLDTCAC
jgi:hypothetical protein